MSRCCTLRDSGFHYWTADVSMNEKATWFSFTMRTNEKLRSWRVVAIVTQVICGGQNPGLLPAVITREKVIFLPTEARSNADKKKPTSSSQAHRQHLWPLRCLIKMAAHMHQSFKTRALQFWILPGEISGSHGGEYGDGRFLGCCPV
jgi:hypothetical protein